ncbi:MAG: hypothetical protein A2Y17_00655 [Clostridiales bacterium GWF2_38_85]|nr:MAG: hypothetical protein A2Y17_00655 [Clostridiales bacterium GWF2_38_85]
MKIFEKYIIALTNLNGIIPIKKVVEVYNIHYNQYIDIEKIKLYINIDLKQNNIYICKNYFVHKIILVCDDYEVYMRKKRDKPYYTPNIKKLLKFYDIYYFEKSNQYYKLYNYMYNICHNSEIVEKIIKDFTILYKYINDQIEIYRIINMLGIYLEDKKKLDEVMYIFNQYKNTIRLWENNGFTKYEDCVAPCIK